MKEEKFLVWLFGMMLLSTMVLILVPEKRRLSAPEFEFTKEMTSEQGQALPDGSLFVLSDTPTVGCALSETPTPTPIGIFGVSDFVSTITSAYLSPHWTIDPYPQYKIYCNNTVKEVTIEFEDAVFPIKIVRQYFNGDKYVVELQRQYEPDKKGRKK